MEAGQVTGMIEGEGRTGGWYAVNDDVMGGISQSRPELTIRKTLRFFGEVSLENNGGFASIRTDARPFGIGDGDGIRINVKGDGKVYQLRVQISNWYDGIAVPGAWHDRRGSGPGHHI